MNSSEQRARRLVEHSGEHPVISLYLDLDPDTFATPPARASQIRSLIDEGTRTVENDQQLGHEDRAGLRADLKRIEEFLHSPEAPFQGARALAVFCSSADGLFEAVQLSRPVTGRLLIGRSPYVEPLLEGAQRRRWLVALVSRGSAQLWAGSPGRLRQQERLQDGVHGQHDQGGWSQARYERSVEKEVEDHLRQFAEAVERRWRAERFDRLALGGPQEIVPRFQELLSQDLLAHLASERVRVDLSSAGQADVLEAVERVAEEDERRTEREALDRMDEGVAGAGRATRGLKDTVLALNERRVEQLLIDPGLAGQGRRCPTCGLLMSGQEESCPADGTPTTELDLREAVVEAALIQDAEVTVIRHHEDLRQAGIGALLRF
ncbi:MAG TPA: Vms1/Ankzf1 family peptidyl-tRNA hydrolase [Solirubrobacteraceae bacterium]|nr:Vms1/Ankzf1 family peptidyl-tRNA hydrolase [Solirubrobacteraceae bacterium]